MDDKERMEIEHNQTYARDWRAVCQEANLFAQKRCSELADEFTRLEVQIAAILIAFTGIFVDKFGLTADGVKPELLPLKILYATAISMFILSLVLGLVHIKRKEKWWDGFVKQRSRRVDGWDEAVLGVKTIEEARINHEATGPGKGQISYSPLWTWVLQTISLGIGGVLLFAEFLMLVFR